MLLVPRHDKCFAEAQITVHIRRLSKVIPRTAFSGKRVAEALVNGFNVAATTKKFRRTRAIRASLHWTGGCYVGLDVPVGRPARVVVRHGGQGQSCIPAVNTGKLPSSHHRFDSAISRAQEGSALAERHLPYAVGVDLVPYVEVGVAVPATLTNGIDDERRSGIAGRSLQPGSVI